MTKTTRSACPAVVNAPTSLFHLLCDPCVSAFKTLESTRARRPLFTRKIPFKFPSERVVVISPFFRLSTRADRDRNKHRLPPTAAAPEKTTRAMVSRVHHSLHRGDVL